MFKKDNEKTEEVKISDKTFKLSYTYINTVNLRNCLNKGSELATKDLNNGKLDLPDQCRESFNTFKSYLKDIINLCYFDIELSEKHMDLIYPMVHNFLTEADRVLTGTINECNAEFNKIEDRFNKSDQHIKSMEMAEYLNSPTYVTTNNVDGSVYGMASKLGKAPTGETNSFIQGIRDENYYRTKKEYRNALQTNTLGIFEKFNNQLVNLLIQKADNLFTSEDYSDNIIWLEYIKNSKIENLDSIYKCVNFYNINLKSDIEQLVVNNSLDSKETDKNYLDFYKLINESKEIDISSQLVDIITKNLTKKINKMDDLSEKETLISKETKKLDNIPHLKSDDKIIVINNLNKEIKKREDKFEKDELEYKKYKKKKITKIILIILGIAILIGLMICFLDFFIELLSFAIGIGIIYLIFKFLKKLFY